MSDCFFPSNIDFLLKQVLKELKTTNNLFGYPIDKNIIVKNNRFESSLFHQKIKYPLGVAAGPHTQLSQNIISAWMNGARYIELKTIQTLDELEVSKPCIDVQDEGFNCEWSQELRIKESFSQYLDAWILLHIIANQFNISGIDGAIFNMSVGYNLEGILQENVQWFFSKMADCKAEKEQKLELIRPIFPQIDTIKIPDCISNNITLSTMHGCPPDEIEKIASYLIKDKKLHTYVKLNPTLLGSKEVRQILNDRLKFKTIIPDEAFGHDLKWDDAVPMISRLQKLSVKNNVEFGLKLTNTLESENHRTVFKPENAMMYMSGRALHPISVNLARKIQNQFEGQLNISFAGGADAFNFPNLIVCGLKPVTVCTDLLKPGGYGRLPQYIKELQYAFETTKSGGIDEYILNSNKNKQDVRNAALENLNKYAGNILDLKQYKRTYYKQPSIKGERELGYFDCIAAPCMENCATTQNIPQYLDFCANGEIDKAFEVILDTNPFPSVTGNICDHLCQLRCTRMNYDDSLQIREVKRFIEENHRLSFKKEPIPLKGKKVSIIGAGPSGLSCAYYLLQAGFEVNIYEATKRAGGMVANAVPSFRLNDEQIARDVDRIKELGGKIYYECSVDKKLYSELEKTSDFIYIATGARLSVPLNLPNSNAKGIIEPLQFLFDVRKGKTFDIGKNIAIIGGGNTAMDVARVVWRLTGNDCKITILYRRTIAEMPADKGEIEAVLDEGISIIENVAPKEIKTQNDAVKSLILTRMEVKPQGGGTKPVPQVIAGSEFEVAFDTIIPAIGQAVDIDFIPVETLKIQKETLTTALPNVYIGGDAMRGAATAIKAIGDGRKVAEKIINESNISYVKKSIEVSHQDIEQLLVKKGVRISASLHEELPVEQRRNFKPVTRVMTQEEAQVEASRCLRCDQICNVCVTVCPNRANFAYKVKSRKIQLYLAELVGENIEWKTDTLFEVTQEHQILNLPDWCNECGNCTTFCPTAEAPYREKPHLHLSIKSMNQSEEGYYLSKLPQKEVLIYKEKGGIRTLEKQTDRWIYETDHVLAEFDLTSFKPLKAVFKVPCLQQAHFRMAAEMSVIFEGAMQVM